MTVYDDVVQGVDARATPWLSRIALLVPPALVLAIIIDAFVTGQAFSSTGMTWLTIGLIALFLLFAVPGLFAIRRETKWTTGGGAVLHVRNVKGRVSSIRLAPPTTITLSQHVSGTYRAWILIVKDAEAEETLTQGDARALRVPLATAVRRDERLLSNDATRDFINGLR